MFEVVFEKHDYLRPPVLSTLIKIDPDYKISNSRPVETLRRIFQNLSFLVPYIL